MPSSNIDPRVDAYIEALPEWQQAICRQVRALIHAADPNKTARTIAIRRGEKIDAPALEAMLEQIILNNRAGGWRKLKARAQ